MFAYIKEQKNNNKVEENEKDGEQTLSGLEFYTSRKRRVG